MIIRFHRGNAARATGIHQYWVENAIFQNMNTNLFNQENSSLDKLNRYIPREIYIRKCQLVSKTVPSGHGDMVVRKQKKIGACYVSECQKPLKCPGVPVASDFIPPNPRSWSKTISRHG